MKILHIIPNLQTGGAESLMVDLLPRLQDEGNSVELLLFDGIRTPFYNILEAKGIRIHTLGTIKNVYHPLYLWRMYRFLRCNKYDVIHTHNTAPQLFAALCSALCTMILCTTEHSTSNRRRSWKWYRPIDKWMYSRYRRIICISDAAEKNLREHLKLQQDDAICTIYNGVDVKRYTEARPTEDIHPIHGRKAIIMVGRFCYQKDQDTLIRAIALLPEERYELWLLGNGERENELRKLSIQLGVEKRVRFLGIRMDVANVLKAADIVVMSSHFEGLSLSNIEGMASGRPFVASDVDGLREVTNGYGILFPHEDAQALANTLRQLSQDTNYYDEIVKRCLERAMQYDISEMAKKYNKVYYQVYKK